MNIALTGASGFLGRNFVPAAVAKGHTLFALARDRDSALTLKKDGAQRVVLGSLEQQERVAGSLLEDADVFVNLAALGVQSRDRQWQTVVQCNAVDPIGWLEEACRCGVRHVVGVGTCMEYQGYGTLPDTPWVSEGDAPRCSEGDPLEPRDAYGASKAAGGILFRAFARSQGLPAWYLRFASLYGLGDDANKLIPAACNAALQSRPFSIRGGLQVRDWLNVDDAVEALLASCERPPSSGGDTLNIGTSQGQSVREVVEEVYKALGRSTNSVHVNEGEYRPGEIHHLVLASDRAMEVLGWRASMKRFSPGTLVAAEKVVR